MTIKEELSETPGSGIGHRYTGRTIKEKYCIFSGNSNFFGLSNISKPNDFFFILVDKLKWHNLKNEISLENYNIQVIFHNFETKEACINIKNLQDEKHLIGCLF